MGRGRRSTCDTANASGGAAEDDILVSIENLTGSPHRDYFSGNNDANTLNGRGGDDALRGWGGIDTLLGGTGNDRLVAAPAPTS